MLEMLAALLRGVLMTLGLTAAPEPSALAVAVIAVAAVAIFAIALHASGAPVVGERSPVHPIRARDVSTPLSQSDPDAAGHSRPRAPGVAAQAA